jgi:hypothetical protein
MARTLPGRSVAALVTLAALAPAPAVAQPSPPPPLPGDAAIYQYREALPTAAGPVAPTAATNRVTPLAAAIQERLATEGGTDARLLERVATSTDFGAPAGPRQPDAEARPTAPDGLPPASLSRATRAAGGALGDFPARLVVVLALILGLALPFAVAARRAPRATA